MYICGRQRQPPEGSPRAALFDSSDAWQERTRQGIGKRNQEATRPKIERADAMLKYPVTLKRDTNGTILVGFPDFPEAHTFGDDADEAMMHAVDALETALSMYIDDRRPIPVPSAVKARGKAVIVPAL